MLSVSEKYAKAINADSRRMLHRVTLNGAVLDLTSVPKMTLDENIGGNSGVAVGTANSASLKLTLRNPQVTDYTEMLVIPESGLELPDGTVEWIPLGKFYVTDSSTSNDYRTIDLTCADGMYLMSGDYVSNLTYPALVRDVAREIVNQAGVEFDEPAEWPAIFIRKKPEKQTLRNAIGYVAGCCGKNARFNRYGRLEFVWYKDTGLTIERRQQYLDGFTRLNDQPLYVNFEVTGEEERYKVEIVSDGNGNIIATPGTNVKEGETVTLAVVPLYEYELASLSAVTSLGASVTLWQNAEGSEYTFVQPDSDVTVTATFKFSADDPSGGGAVVSGGEYSFLQHPSFAPAPTQKRYWAIFYKHDTDVGPNAKYYLVWFDSWSLGDSIYLEDKRGYYINIDGYYYCRGANNGRGQHKWDNAVWQGNGASGTTLTWRMGVGRGCDGYGLVASNLSLYDGDTLIFTNNESEIGTAQTGWLVNGVDIREKGVLSLYTCPDAYSTPLPGKNWMLTNKVYVYKLDTDGSYETLFSGSSYDPYILFFDGCVIQDIGKYYDFHEGNYLKITFSKLVVASYLNYTTFYYSNERTFDEECYVIISDPDYSSNYESGGGLEYPIGLYAANFSSSYFSNNSPMICNCASSASELTKFAMRKNAGANVTMQYTNPLITSKMVEGISALVESVYYTPSKVKHRGNPALEVGDIVTVPDKDGNYHTVLIMQQTMTFGGGMNAEITCPGQTEKKTSFSTTGALTTQIKKVVQEESYYQQKASDAYNSVVVSALNRSMSSLSRRVTEDEVALKSLSEWRGQASVTLAELGVTVGEHSVSIEGIAQWQSDTAKTMASIDQRVSNNEASIKLLSKWEGEGAESLAELVAKVNANEANIALVVENNAVKGSVLVEAINGQSTVKVNADVIEFSGEKLNIKVDSTNIEGKLIASQIDTDGLVINSGNIAGFYVSDLGLDLVNLSADETEYDAMCIDTFQAGLYYYSSTQVTVRNYGSGWYNKVYPLGDAKKVSISGLPGSNCEVFILAKHPSASDSVSSAYDTSKAILPYYHNGSPGTSLTIDVSDTIDELRYLVINSSADIEPYVKTTHAVPTMVASLHNDGSFELLTADNNRISMGKFADGIDIETPNGEITIFRTGGLGYYNPTIKNYVADYDDPYQTDGYVFPITFGCSSEEGYHHYLNGTWYIDKFGSATPITSDRTKKNSIENQSEVYSKIFDRLVPVTFKYNNGTSDRTHLGLIAQDVEAAVMAEGLTTKDFAPVVYEINKDGNKVNYGIRYEELVSLCIHEIQKLKAKLEERDG